MEELLKIQASIGSIKMTTEEFEENIQGELNNEIESILKQIYSTGSDKIQKNLDEQNQRLENFEQKLFDIKISDSDQFYLNKEINRYKNSLNAIESSRDLYLDTSKEIEGNVDQKM